DAGCRAGGARRSARACPDPDVLPGALRHSGCGSPGLPCVLRARTDFSPHDGKGARIMGPASAPLARLKKEHRFQFLLKSPRRSVLTKLLTGALSFCDANEIPQTAILVDMDPLTLM